MKEFNKEFFDNFPILYKDYVYIECHTGWYDLLFELSVKLEDILKEKETKECTIQVDQIKSKFGGLRFYITFIPFIKDNYIIKYNYNIDISAEAYNLIYSLINEYEAKSYQTCEFCGKQPATQMGKGWIYTACKDCETIKQIIK